MYSSLEEVWLEHPNLYDSVGLDNGPHPGAHLGDSGPHLQHELQLDLVNKLEVQLKKEDWK